MPSGALTKLTGPKPVVRRANELRRLFARAANRLERRPVGHQDPPVNEIVLGVADEGVAVEFGRIRAAPVDRHAGAGVDHVMAGAG